MPTTPTVQLSRNFLTYSELMFNALDPVQIASFNLYQKDDPFAAFVPGDLLANIPNIPGGSDISYAEKVLPSVKTNRTHKIYYRVPKQEDLTWHYKLVPVDHRGAETQLLTDIVARTILSFEETNNYFGVQGPSRSTAYQTATVTIPDTVTSWLSPFVYDFIARHGRPGFRLRFRAIDDTDVFLKLNNRNNLPIAVPLKTDDFTWDDLYDESYGGIWIHRLLFINESGGDVDVEIDYSHGLQ